MSLGIDFYKKLISVCARVNVKPEDVLLIMTLESGLNPAAVNKDGGAAGLVQFMPFILRDVYKYDPASYDNRKFNQLSGVEQLDTIEKHLKNLSRGRGFKSAAQLYIGNFFPVALGLAGVQAMNPSTPIVEQDPKTQKYKNVKLKTEIDAYNSNKGLDSNKDGVITYGDIESKMRGAAGSKIYKDALKMLEQAKLSGDASNDEVENKDSGEFMESNLSKEIDKYLKIVAANTKFYNIKNNDIAESTEIARAISSILYNEGINSFIMTDGKNIQLKVMSSIDARDFIEEDILEPANDLKYKIASANFQAKQYRRCLIKGLDV